MDGISVQVNMGHQRRKGGVTDTPQTPSRPHIFPSPSRLFCTPQNHHEPNPQPPTPRTGSPCQHQWTTNLRGVHSRMHPLLNGESVHLMLCNMLIYVVMKVNHVIPTGMTFPTIILSHPGSSVTTTTSFPFLPTQSLSWQIFCSARNRWLVKKYRS